MRKLSWILGGLLFVATAVSVNLWRELGAERSLTAQLRAQLNAPVTATPSISIAPADAPPVAAAVPEKGAAESATPAAPVAATATPVRNTAVTLPDFIRDQQEMMKDPEYRAARLAQTRMTISQQYPGLVEVLQLTPEEASRLFDVLADHQMEISTASIAATVINGQQPDQAAMQQAIAAQQEIQRRQNEAVSNLLGPGRAAQWQGYQENQAAYIQAAQVSRMMEGAGQPVLNDSQTRAMREIYIAEQARMRDESRTFAQQMTQGGGRPDQVAMMERQQAMQAERNKRIVEASSRHLNPTQVDALRTSLEQQLTMTRASQRIFQQRQQQQGQSGEPGAAAAGPTVVVGF